MHSPRPDFDALEAAIRRDPSGRGPASFLWRGHPLGAGQLEAAARSLAENARSVAIVTGFAVHDGGRYVAETDGPPGALALASVLTHRGAQVALISDAIGMPALDAGRRELAQSVSLLEFPLEEGDEASAARMHNAEQYCRRSDAWVAEFLGGEFGRDLTHLISIERVGPSHTLTSLTGQLRSEPSPEADFLRDVPLEHRDVCHNMRGIDINGSTAKIHRLFEAVQRQKLPVATIGIGDGGNELGMGQFPWEALKAAIAHGPAGQVACRIATQYTIIAGVSNWGGYALAAAIDALAQSNFFKHTWDARREQQLLEALISQAHCVDGLTRRRETTVDGLPAEQLAAFWRELLAAA